VDDVSIQHAMAINGWTRALHSNFEPDETIAREKKRGLWAWE
jgi:hypothetical protein